LESLSREEIWCGDFLFIGEAISPPFEFILSGWSCMELTYLESSVSNNGADGLKVVERALMMMMMMMMMIGEVVTARQIRLRIKQSGSDSRKTDGLQFDGDPQYWWFSV
jgi:hypothetical protein